MDKNTLLSNELLNFQTPTSVSTGEVKEEWLTAKYKNMIFKIHNQDTILIQGSLHKFYNQGLWNYDDFTYSQLVDTIKTLEDFFSINPNKCLIQNLETAVNITPPSTTKKAMRAIKLHKNKVFNTDYNRQYKQVKRNHYFLKIYNKGAQQKINHSEILRFEIKSVKSALHNQMNIFTLADLLHKPNLIQLQLKLYKAWEECLFVDETIQRPHLTKKDRNKWSNYSNADWWEEMYDIKTPSTVKYQRDRFYKIQLLHSANNRELIGARILMKFGELLHS